MNLNNTDIRKALIIRQSQKLTDIPQKLTDIRKALIIKQSQKLTDIPQNLTDIPNILHLIVKSRREPDVK